MNIQIFGTSKCFDTKKAERFFKERRIPFQRSVLRAVGGVDRLINWDSRSPGLDLLRYTDDTRAKEDKVFDDPGLMKTPVVRNGKKATVGYCPEVWNQWIEEAKK